MLVCEDIQDTHTAVTSRS